MTFAPSRQIDLFETSDIFPMSSSEARPAKTSAAPTQKAKVSKASEAASTSKPSGSSEKSDLVGSLLRTALISELEALTQSSLRWKRSATPAGRMWSVLVMDEAAPASGPTTSGRAPGSSDVNSARLPTPICNPSGGQSNPGLKARGIIYPALGPLLEIAAGRMDPGRYRGDMEGWARLPTPMASDGMQGGKGGGAGSTYPFRMILATPRKTDADRGGRGDVLSQLRGDPSKHAGMPLERLPTPTKRDKRMDAWSPAYDKRKSPSMDAVLDGASTGRATDKWIGARALATILQSHGLSGTAALPVTYGWMMGFPPGWLARALQSAVHSGHLPQALSSKRSATPSARKSQKQ